MYNEAFAYPYPHRTGRRGGHRGGGAGNWADPWFGPGYAAAPGWRRGSGARLALLTLLRADSPRSGYQLMQDLAGLGYGYRRPGPGLVYGTLAQLEDEGLIRETVGEPGAGRTFELTDAGTAYLDRLGSRPGPWGPPGTGLPALHQATRAIAAAAREVARDGDGEKAAKAAGLLNETRKALYRLLTGDAE